VKEERSDMKEGIFGRMVHIYRLYTQGPTPKLGCHLVSSNPSRDTVDHERKTCDISGELPKISILMDK
jgi:hypothetical protein